mgnify:CR=1 FL=1
MRKLKRVSALFTLLLFLGNISFAQKLRNHKTGPDRKFGIFMNTLSLLEIQQAAIGAGINYKIAHRWDTSLELNYLFDGFMQAADDYNSQGYRGIITLKRFSKTRVFFYGLDLRLKYFSFSDKREFKNETTGDTLYNFEHDAANTLIGVAGITGVRLPISRNKKWAFEFNTGIGIKLRTVTRKNIPAGYEYFNNDMSRHYNYTTGQDISGETPYFPTAVRIMYFF